jgi:hypothetical protein
MPPSSTASTIAMFLSGAENIIQLKTDVKWKKRNKNVGKMKIRHGSGAQTWDSVGI